jgi:MFS family permease
MTTFTAIQPLQGTPAALESPVAAAPPAAPRTATILAMSLLFLASLPDAMVPPVLRGLLIDRYDASPAAAHWFMAVNLVGALVALPILSILRRRLSPARLLCGAALANSVLLLALAFPVGLGPSLLLRLFEGAADLLVVAVLFDLIAKSGRPRHRGRRLGAGGTLMLIGLAAGAVIGGWLGRLDPALVFIAGGGACLALALIALPAREPLNQLVRFCPATEFNLEAGPAERPLWPALGMVATDRAVAGVLATSVPLFLSQATPISPAMIGVLLALPLLIMALGSWPAGWLGDRVGHLRLRSWAAILYAGAFALLPIATQSPLALAALMIMIGVGGAALMPASMSIASRSGRGSVAMGAYHAAGSLGFLLGIAGAGSIVSLTSAAGSPVGPYVTIILSFALVHGLGTCVWRAALRAKPDLRSPRGRSGSRLSEPPPCGRRSPLPHGRGSLPPPSLTPFGLRLSFWVRASPARIREAGSNASPIPPRLQTRCFHAPSDLFRQVR